MRVAGLFAWVVLCMKHFVETELKQDVIECVKVMDDCCYSDFCVCVCGVGLSLYSWL